MSDTPATQVEVAAMSRALELASLGSPQGPNPRVGAVLLDAAGHELGAGFHRGAGTPHAEVNALLDAAQAGAQVRGATAVVTLEPCNHQGRTPPCSQALIEAGIARVVIAATDPNPQASGGIETLRRAGIEVVSGVAAEQAMALNRAWQFAVTHQRPYVIWKFAATLDGRSAAADGTSRWITSPEARADVHRRRATVDAIAVGTGTVLADDPTLTPRESAISAAPTLAESPKSAAKRGQMATDFELSAQGGRAPLRVVIGHRSVPPTAKVLDDSAPTLIIASHDPHQVLKTLHEREIRSLWLEGGPTVAAAFWRAGLIDEVIAYLAPALLGSGRSAVGELGITTMADIARLEPFEIVQVGPDVRIRAMPSQSSTNQSSAVKESH